jgi:hypothetical protein
LVFFLFRFFLFFVKSVPKCANKIKKARGFKDELVVNHDNFINIKTMIIKTRSDIKANKINLSYLKKEDKFKLLFKNQLKFNNTN